MREPELRVCRSGPVLRVTFQRPRQRNAMTWQMYDGLWEACDRADTDGEVRVLVLTGAGDAFVSGTDIRQFAEFRDGADGVAYERRVTEVLRRLEDVAVPTIAAVRGPCVGAGLLLAAACDLRVATRSARFGVPVARTLGNCLSVDSCARLAYLLGPARVLDLLLRGRFMSGVEAYDAGFLNEMCDEPEFDRVLDVVVTEVLAGAPLTGWATREAIRRLRRAYLPDGDDIVTRVYGSDDFRRGVQAFGAKERIRWTGR